jgi:hypothetical protein
MYSQALKQVAMERGKREAQSEFNSWKEELQKIWEINECLKHRIDHLKDNLKLDESADLGVEEDISIASEVKRQKVDFRRGNESKGRQRYFKEESQDLEESLVTVGDSPDWFSDNAREIKEFKTEQKGKNEFLIEYEVNGNETEQKEIQKENPFINYNTYSEVDLKNPLITPQTDKKNIKGIH